MDKREVVVVVLVVSELAMFSFYRKLERKSVLLLCVCVVM